MICVFVALAICAALVGRHAVLEQVPSTATLPTYQAKIEPSKPTGFLSVSSWRMMAVLGWTEVTTLRGRWPSSTVVAGRMPCGHRAAFGFPEDVVFVGHPDEPGIVEQGARRVMAWCSSCAKE